MKYRHLVALLILCAAILVFAGCGAPANGTLTGTVHGGLEDTVIPGATVTAAGGEETYTTRTGPDGTYSLSLPAGAYHVVAAMDTFNNAAADVAVTAEETAVKDLTLTTGTGTGPLPFPSSVSPSVNGYTVPAQVDMRSLHPGNPGAQDLLASRPPMESNAYRCSAGAYLSMETTDDAGFRAVRVYESATKNGVYAFIGESLFQNGNYVTTAFSEWRKDDPAYQPGMTRYFRFTLYTDAGETAAKGPYAVTFLPPFVLTEPAHNAEGTAKTPTFRWQNFGLADAYCTITMYAFSGGTMQNAGYANLSGDVSESVYGNSNWAWNGPISNPLPGTTRCRWYGYLWRVITTDGLTSYAHTYSYPREFTTQP